MLKLENIHTYYGAIQALNGVSVDVNKGEIVTLIGANGAGKTTLLMTVCGNPRAKEGKITFEGEDITHRTRTTSCATASPFLRKGGACSGPDGRREPDDGRLLRQARRNPRGHRPRLRPVPRLKGAPASAPA